ncbi:MAG TPA: hypothetical protein EYP09_12000 [Anaerolineae bacterium]|nr:hypothetical protein [Anaerolineae bacterium]
MYEGMILAGLAGACLAWGLTAKRRLRPTPPRRRWAEHLAAYAARARGLMPEREFLILTALSAIVPAAALIMVLGPVGLGGLAGGAVIPELVLRRRRRKREEMLEEQVTAAIMSLVRCLKAGLPLLKAIEHLAETMDEPIRSPFAHLRDRLYTGITLSQAIEELREGTPSPRLWQMLKVIKICQEESVPTADMVEMLSRLGDNLALNARLRQAIYAQTAGTRASQWLVMGLIPLVFLATLRIPAIAQFYRHDPMGRLVLGIILLLETAAIVGAQEVTRFKGPLSA